MTGGGDGFRLHLTPAPPAVSTRPSPRYTLEVQPSKRTEGAFEWAIRDRGKLIQRSDRVERSEEAARKRGERAIEELTHGRE
jgi:hypothetical protein